VTSIVLALQNYELFPIQQRTGTKNYRLRIRFQCFDFLNIGEDAHQTEAHQQAKGNYYEKSKKKKAK